MIALTATGINSDISLNGNLLATNTGLTAAQNGITVNAGRDILVASTTNITTASSGALRLAATRNIDLKVDDSGFSGANNALTAVGNLDLVATSGQIVRSDGNLVSLSASTVALTAGTNIGAFGDITATAGTVTLGAGTTLSTSGFTVTAPGNVTLTAPGAISVSTVNATGANSDINITSSTAGISAGTLAAGNDIALRAVTGLSLGAITAGTAGNGLVTLGNSGAASDINLTGNLQATNAGLADTAAAISVTSGRDILIASTTNLTSVTSGAIRLNAARAVNLKVDDFGFSGANNALTAAGNLDITAGTSISRTDNNAISGSGKAVSLLAGTTIAPGGGGGFTASTGDLTFTATGSINTSGLGMGAAQNLVLTGAGITTSNLSATAGFIDINSSAGVGVGNLSAGTSISVDGAAFMSLGALSTGNGVIALAATGINSDISLNGNLLATNTGLTADRTSGV